MRKQRKGERGRKREKEYAGGGKENKRDKEMDLRKQGREKCKQDAGNNEKANEGRGRRMWRRKKYSPHKENKNKRDKRMNLRKQGREMCK